MKLKKILLAGTFLLASSLAFSQNKLKFDVYSKGEGFISPRLNTSSLRVDSNKIGFSFLWGIYSMEIEELTDSTYREIVKNNFLLQEKNEFFEYSKDSCYIFLNYFVTGRKPREEKKLLEGRVFDKKYRGLPELVRKFEQGLIVDGDSLHFIVNGMPYSVEVNKRENKDSVIYSCSLEDIIKREPGDMIICPYPIEVYAIRKDGKLVPIRFYTKLLNVRNGKNTHIEGILRKEKE